MSREKADKEEKKGFKREALSWVICIVVTILLTEFILNFVIINANIPSGSMENTIMTNDKLIALRTSYWFNDPKRGDIIIFKYPDDESQLFIKRLIGLPGDTVEIRNGKVFINGVEDEKANSHVPETPTGNYGPYVVPEGSYFMLGDNREHSKDSRFWQNTFVTYDEIVGKAIVRYYPSIKVLE